MYLIKCCDLGNDCDFELRAQEKGILIEQYERHLDIEHEHHHITRNLFKKIKDAIFEIEIEEVTITGFESDNEYQFI